MTLYFAYGSNLNLEQMARRAPGARSLGSLTLLDYRLVFRGVADIVPSPGDRVQGGVWKLTPSDEDALDRYEGVDSGMYRKVLLDIEPSDSDPGFELLIYVMNSTGIMPPPESYLASIRQGYRDFDLRLRPLNDAVRASWDDKAPSHIERQRYRRNGRPRLAPAPLKLSAAK